jgi:hypothetical protein
MQSRREARRHFEANDDCRHQSHFAAAQPPRRSEYAYSHTTYPHGASVAHESNQDPYIPSQSPYEGSQGRPFDNNVVVPPFAPDPPSTKYGDASSFRLSSGRDGYTSYGGYQRRDGDDFSDDERYSSPKDWM